MSSMATLSSDCDAVPIIGMNFVAGPENAIGFRLGDPPGPLTALCYQLSRHLPYFVECKHCLTQRGASEPKAEAQGHLPLLANVPRARPGDRLRNAQHSGRNSSCL